MLDASARAEQIDPAETVITPLDAIKWSDWINGFPPHRAPHYDGVKRGAKEPAVIALFGIAPVQFELVDRSKPAWRQV